MKTFILTLVLALPLMASNYEIKNTAIENAFIPPVGYDSNDNVEVVLTGRLPGLCYELGKETVVFDRATKTFKLQQAVHKRDYLDCNQESNSVLNTIHPRYKNIVSLGRLEAGEYKIIFGNDADGVKNFSVSKYTANQTIDENLYAPLTSAYISDIVGIDQTPRVILAGLVEKSCLTFSPNDAELNYYKDVIVLLPKLKINSEDCVNQNKQIQTVIPLKRLPKGQYLLHIRTLSGGSINKIFSITGQVPQNH